MKLKKIFIMKIFVFLAIAVTIQPTYAKVKNSKTIPETFTKGTWIGMPIAKYEKGYCNNNPEAESDSMMVYTFKKNNISISYYEHSTEIKILSLTEVSPQKIKGKAKFTTTDYDGTTTSTGSFEFSIKNNRLYSPDFSKEYEPRASKYGLFHCEK